MQPGFILADLRGEVQSLNPAALDLLGQRRPSPAPRNMEMAISAARASGGEPLARAREALAYWMKNDPLGAMEVCQPFPRAGWDVQFSWIAFEFPATGGTASQLLFIGKRLASPNPMRSLPWMWEPEPDQPELTARLRAVAMKLEEAMEWEKSRIAREIHDDVGQALCLLRSELRLLEIELEGESMKPALSVRTAHLAAMLNSASDAMRRAINGLYPPVLMELGLAAALEWHLGNFTKATGVVCQWDLSGAEGLPVEQSLAAFRVAQEALTNVARHSGAKRVKLTLKQNHTGLALTVADDGIGILGRGAGKVARVGTGLSAMQRRAWEHGGYVKITARPGKGVTLKMVIPRSASDDRRIEANAPGRKVRCARENKAQTRGLLFAMSPRA